MENLFPSLSGGQFLGLAGIVCGCLVLLPVLVLETVMPHWRRVRQVEGETQLKRDLLAAGFGADEIERVVRATAEPTPKGCKATKCGRAAVNESASPASV